MRKEKLTFYHIESLKDGKDILLGGKVYESNVHYFEKDHSFRESLFESLEVKRSFYDDNVEEKEDKKLYTLTQLKKEFELYPTSKAPVRGYMYTKKYGCYPMFLKKDCLSIAKSDEEKERNHLLKEKREATAKINRTCEYCDVEQQNKIKRIVDERRMCSDCYDRMCKINHFRDGNPVEGLLKGFSYSGSNLDIKNYKDLEFEIVREKDNYYDENAIMVFARNKQLTESFEKIGYIERGVADFVAPIIDEDAVVDIQPIDYLTVFYESYDDFSNGFETKHIMFKLQKKK